jgi:hypothetical protein
MNHEAHKAHGGLARWPRIVRAPIESRLKELEPEVA